MRHRTVKKQSPKSQYTIDEKGIIHYTKLPVVDISNPDDIVFVAPSEEDARRLKELNELKAARKRSAI